MDKVSYKHSLVMAYMSACKSESNKLYFLTSAGIIEGTYINIEMEKSLKSDIIYNFHDALEKNARKVSNSPSESVLLKDVVVKTSSQEFCFEYLHVFIEDIIAVTIGNSVDV